MKILNMVRKKNPYVSTKKLNLKKTTFFRFKHRIVVYLLVAGSFGCEGYVEYSGIIYDSESNLTIDSVQCIIVEFKDRNYYTYSDSVGQYYVSTPLVGCVPNCDEYTVEFSKQGYKSQTVKSPCNIFLEKE